jgi:hypothetical protein
MASSLSATQRKPIAPANRTSPRTTFATADLNSRTPCALRTQPCPRTRSRESIHLHPAPALSCQKSALFWHHFTGKFRPGRFLQLFGEVAWLSWLHIVSEDRHTDIVVPPIFQFQMPAPTSPPAAYGQRLSSAVGAKQFSPARKGWEVKTAQSADRLRSLTRASLFWAR